MKFGPVPVAAAEGAILAHAVRIGGLILRKGTVLSPEDVARLEAARVESVVVARLETGDIGENAAAVAIARAVAGSGIRVEMPQTGRANLFAEAAGVFQVDAARVDALNVRDEAITLATLPDQRAVVAGEMVGTVKIIPFAVPDALVAEAVAAGQGALSLAPYRTRPVTVISTVLPGLKPSVIDKTLAVLNERLAPMGAEVTQEMRVPHDAGALAAALERAEGAGLVIVFGASAITDRSDVIPAALVASGGIVAHFGMPVDPGNLLMIGARHGVPVIGAPGCARSPRENGFDWVLQRIMADVAVTRADIQRMGVGGLLMEIVSRPQPRDPSAEAAVQPVAPLGVLVLAAGRSTRMGGPNKLLADVAGKPLVRHAVEQALAARIGPVVVVTGHMGGEVRAALAGCNVTFADNPAFAEGLSTSLKAGITALPEVAGVAVLLGDMPEVSAAVLRRLAGVFREHPTARAVVPTSLGERGNPVIIARSLFPAVQGLAGDIGARRLIEAAGTDVVEVPVDDPGIHRDIDTPEALAALRDQKRT